MDGNIHWNGPEHTDLLRSLRGILDHMEKFRLDICKALCYDGGAYTFDHVVAEVMHGKLDVYILPDAIILCSVHEHQTYRCYNVYIVAGNLDQIIDFQREQLPYEARIRRCKYLTFSGRKGWLRALEREGWKPTLVSMAKEVGYVEEDGQSDTD